MHLFFEAGLIWAPDMRFAEEVVEECAAFPHGDHDDLVDSMTMAVMRFRQGGFITHPEDYVIEKQPPRKENIIKYAKNNRHNNSSIKVYPCRS